MGGIAKRSLRDVVRRLHFRVQHECKQFCVGQAADQFFQQCGIVLAAGSLSLFLLRTEAGTQRAKPVLQFFEFAPASRVGKPAVLLQSLALTPNEAAKQGWKINQDGQKRSAWDYLAYPDIGFAEIETAFPELQDLDQPTKTQLGIEAIYSGYIERQRADVEALRRDEAVEIPKDFDYARVGGLSNEARSKLETIRPSTIGQASRIEGVTPGALIALLSHVKRSQKLRSVG